MTPTTADKRPKFYLDANDAIEHLGITRRQLRHWEDKGLIEPELGKNRYTEKDLAQLRLIKRLVVDEGFPVEIVRRLFEKQLWGEEVEDLAYERGRSGDFTNYVLDIDTGTLLEREEIFKRLWNEFIATAEKREIEALLAQLYLVYLRDARFHSRTPGEYEEAFDKSIDRLGRLDRVARLELVHAEADGALGPVTGLRLRPQLQSDSHFDKSHLDDDFSEHEPAITELQAARDDLFRRGRQVKPGRFEDFSDYADLRRGEL
jgi:DNA-binding transcriptional MerR regulator